MEWTTGIEIPGKSEVIELDITIRVNSKLKNFIVSFYLDKWTLKNWQEWYMVGTVLQWIGYMDFTSDNSLTQVMQGWLDKINKSTYNVVEQN